MEKELGFFEHLEELRARIIRSFFYIVLGAIICWWQYNRIYEALVEPALKVLPKGRDPFQLLRFPEAFLLKLEVCLILGIVVGGPLIIYEIWAFVAPGLYRHERRWVLTYLPMAIIFFIGGLALAYFVFPIALRWLISYNPPHAKFEPLLTDYFLFMAKVYLGFGVVFELPVLVMLLAQLGIVSSKGLAERRRYAIVAMVVIACILTPGDLFMVSLVLVAPMLFLYEVSIILAKLVERGRAAAGAEAAITTAGGSSSSTPPEEAP